MGAGKSATAIALHDAWRCKRTLILCPTTVRSVWRREIARHAGRDHEVVVLDHGSVARRTTLARNAYDNCRKPLFIVANYEMGLYEPFPGFCRWTNWDLVILDEAQRVMRESKTAMFVNSIRHRAKRRLCLTGTPLTQDAVSVWAQCRFLDPRVFGEDMEAFKERFENKYAVGVRKAAAKCNEVLAKRGWGTIIWPENAMRGTINTEEFLQRLSGIAFRVENAVLNLPPLTVERRTFTLSARARVLYDTIMDGHGYEVESGRWINVEGSYATTMRLQQITSGFLPDADGKPVVVDLGKAQCLKDILTEAGGEPVVVFGRFTEDLNTTRYIAGKLGLRYGEISQRSKDGLTSTGTMADNIEVCGVQEQAGGAGIDLSRARLAVDYSPSWSLTNYDQKLARVHRPPQTRPVIIYRLEAEDSVDQEIHRALAARRSIVSQVWGELETASAPSP